MKQHLRITRHEELLTLLEGLCYTNRPYWYGVTARPLCMDVLLPRERAGNTLPPRPAIVWCCGGGWQQESRAVWLPELVWYARQGYVCASVDYRLSADAPFPACVEDVRTAVRFLRAHAAELCIDPNRIAIMGESAGGYLACMTALTADDPLDGDWASESSAVQAVVDFYGKVDMRFGDHAADLTAAYLADGCDPAPLSPVNRVTPAAPPFLIFHGSEDPLVPIAESEQLYERLTSCGVPADFYVLDGSGHGDGAFYQQEVRNLVLDFLSRTLR